MPRFRERGRGATGVADEGYSTQAAFLDYDRDGDLDLFLINNSPRPVSSFGLRNTRNVRDPYGGRKLYRNDGGRFADVSAAAGIYGSEIAFGLGVGVGDVNRDGWPDIYVANDFFERDYLYVNSGDGTFAEALDRQMPVLSYFSMGLDIADVNNDGWPDVYTTDMLPEDEYRLKHDGGVRGVGRCTRRRCATATTTSSCATCCSGTTATARSATWGRWPAWRARTGAGARSSPTSTSTAARTSS